MTTQDEAMAALMNHYDQLYPDANPFSRSLVAGEYRKTLVALDALGFRVENSSDESGRLRAMVDVLLPVARLYDDAFASDEMMTMPERLRLQQVQDVLADPDGWSPDRAIGDTP